MAVESKGFSIREYASEMRNVDVVKCWPFNAESDAVSKEVIEALLPPITVKKFRWWSDELELVRPTEGTSSSVKSRGESSKPLLDESTLESENVEKETIELILDPDAVKLDFVCPICRNFTAPTALAAVSHVDWCLARGLRGEQRQKQRMKAKAKSRTPKKRSIVEIFAVAPQVERVDSDDDEWEDEEDSSDQENEVDNSKQMDSYSGVGLDMKYKKGKKPKLKHETTGKLKKQKETTKLKKNVETKNGRHCVDRFLQSIAKEKPRKLKLQSLVKFIGKPKCSHHGKSVIEEIRDAAFIHRKKPSLKCLVKKKNKPVETSKLMKSQKSVIPVCGILKPHKSGTSGENSAAFSLQHDKQENQRGNLQGDTDKHLGFSDRCDFLGPKRKSFPSVDRRKFPSGCRLHSFAGPASAVKGHVMETDKCWATEEANGDEEVVSVSTGSEKEAQPTRERQSSDTRKSNIPTRHSNVPSYKRPDMTFREYLTDSSVATSQSTLQHGCSHTFGQAAPVDPTHSTYRAYIPSPKERNNPSSKTSVEADILGASSTSNRATEYHFGQAAPIDPSHRTYRSYIPSLKERNNPSSKTSVEADILGASGTSKRATEYPFGQAAPIVTSHSTYRAYIPSLKERNNPSSKTSVEADISGASGTSNRSTEYHQSGYPSSAVVTEHAKSSFPQPSSPGFVVSGNSNGRDQPPAQSSFANYPSHYFPYPPSGHLSSKDLIRSLCSVPDWKQRAVTDGNFVNGDLSSLPLNSQGEFIRFNGKGLFNQLMRPTIAETEFSRSFPTQPMRRDNPLDLSHSKVGNFDGGSGIAINHHQLKALPVQNPGKDSPSLSLSSSSYLSSSGSMEEKDPSAYNPNFELMTGSVKYQQVRDPMHVVQPTMRLMGKEFTVGRGSNDLRAFEDGKVWTDKQIIAEHQSPVHTSSLQKQFQKPFTEVRGNLGAQVRPASQRPIQMKPPDWFVNHSTGSGYPNHFSNVKGNSGTRLPPFSRTPSFKEPIERGGHGSPRPTIRMPKFQPIHGNGSQKLAYHTNSTFEFPFLPPDSGHHIQASRLQNFPKGLPPWLLNATHQKTQNDANLSYADVGKYHPCEEHSPKSSEGCNVMPVKANSLDPESRGASIEIASLDKVYGDPSTIPSEENTGKSSDESNTMPAEANSLDNEPCGDSTQMASHDKVHEDLTGRKERTCPKIGVEEVDQGTKPRKRPALVSDDSDNPAKVPNLAVTEDSCAETALSSSMAALGLDSTVVHKSTEKCDQIETQINETRLSPATDALKPDCVGITGPAKLSAGAKHILKPSPNVNKEDSRPTHSTIPFATSASSSRIPQSEKSSQIYKF